MPVTMRCVQGPGNRVRKRWVRGEKIGVPTGARLLQKRPIRRLLWRVVQKGQMKEIRGI